MASLHAQRRCIDFSCHSRLEVGPASCAIKELWIKVKDAVEEILEATTLADLVEQQRALVSKNIDGAQVQSKIP